MLVSVFILGLFACDCSKSSRKHDPSLQLACDQRSQFNCRTIQASVSSWVSLIISWLHIGHTHVTHYRLFSGRDQFECEIIEHILKNIFILLMFVVNLLSLLHWKTKQNVGCAQHRWFFNKKHFVSCNLISFLCASHTTCLMSLVGWLVGWLVGRTCSCIVVKWLDGCWLIQGLGQSLTHCVRSGQNFKPHYLNWLIASHCTLNVLLLPSAE